MTKRSPLIKNGDLVLDESGQLVGDFDVVTQVTTALTAYACIFNSDIDSELIPYLNNPVNGLNSTAITNIVKSAYTPLISANIISDLTIAVAFPVVGYITLKITALDINGNSAELSWTNI